MPQRTHAEDVLKEFANAPSERRFNWADAVVGGKGVLASSCLIRRPAYFRNDWMDHPAGVLLLNARGFPVAPFRKAP